MTKVSIICLPLILMCLVFIGVLGHPKGFDPIHVGCLAAAFVVLCIETNPLGKCATVVVVLVISFVLMQEVAETYRYWPIALGRKHHHKIESGKPTGDNQSQCERYIRLPDSNETNTESISTSTLWFADVSDLWLYPILIISYTCLIGTIAITRIERRISMSVLALVMILIVGAVLQCRCNVWLSSIGCN